MHRAMQFVQFTFDIRGGGGVTDVGVDFTVEVYADDHWVHLAMLQMVDIGRNDGGTERDFVTNKFWCYIFLLGDAFHLRRYFASACALHLSDQSHTASFPIFCLHFLATASESWASKSARATATVDAPAST